LPAVAVAPPKKKSKLPLIIGILAILLILGVGAVVAAFFLVIKPRLDQRHVDRPVVVTEPRNENVNNNNANTNTSENKPEVTEFVAPPNTTKFTNSQANLDGKLAEHYLDFSFYYPDSWDVDPKAGVAGATNFAKVERRLPPDFTQENFAVGWYTSKGTFAADEATFPQLVEVLGGSLEKNFPGYRKVSEGPTKVNSLDAYEFRFESVSKGSEKGDIQVWGRVVFLPTGVSGENTGATLVMLATSLSPELSGVRDVGEKGQMPVILESFRFGKSR
jgi:flagellar basal body-associated protein FliL